MEKQNKSIKARKARKAQMKIQETAFVLIALFLLFALAFLFYFKIQSISLLNKAAELKEEKALSMLEKIVAMPELSCSSASGAQTSSLCIDRDKIAIFSRLVSTRDDYKKIFSGLEQVKIIQIYPASSSEFVIYDAGSQQKEEHSTFVSICEQNKDNYECVIGMIIVAIAPVKAK